MVRVRSWAQRFIDNARKPKEQRNLGELTPSELQNTEYRIIQEAQMEAFTEEMEALKRRKPVPKKSSVLAFTPMLADGLWRSYTRLRNSDELSDETKLFPIILPKRHAVTELVVKYHHKVEGHEMGVNFTITTVFNFTRPLGVFHQKKTVFRLPSIIDTIYGNE